MKFSLVAEKIDTSDFVLNGSSLLYTAAVNQEGQKINVGSLLKIELIPQSNEIKISVRTIYPAPSLAIKETIKSVLL